MNKRFRTAAMMMGATGLVAGAVLAIGFASGALPIAGFVACTIGVLGALAAMHHYTTGKPIPENMNPLASTPAPK